MRINGKLVKLPWKALELGKPDRVYLNIQRSNANNPYTNLKVGVMGGADLMPSMGGDTPKRTYSLMGAAEGEEAIVATFQDSSKTKYAGGIWTATYQSKPFKLYLVPLPGIDISDADRQSLQQDMNTKIFSQAVVTWTVATLPGITGVDLGDNGLDWADKDMLSSYNTEMNGVITSFKDWKKDVEGDAYYLFVVPKFSEGGVEGFMPRNRRFGFITKEQVAMRTVAHELGHGAFNLKHTFPEVPQGTTKNLMDYSDGLALYKPQWDLIHNPEFTTGLWDGMEDGASKGCFRTYNPNSFNAKTYNLNNPEKGKYYTFLTPAGVPISLPYDANNLKFGEDFLSDKMMSAGDCSGSVLSINDIPKSALTSFKLSNIEYKGKINSEDVLGEKGMLKSELIFKGYYKGSETYLDPFSRGKNQFKIYVINKNSELEGIDCEVKTPVGSGEYLGDGKLDPGLNVPCIMSVTTQSTGDFSKETDEFAKKLKTLIVSGGNYISSDDKTIESKNIKDLNDRLSVYSAELSKEGRKIYIVNAQIPYYLDSKGQQDLANQVVNKCGDLFDAKKMTFVCLPYFYSPQSQVSYKPYYFPSCVGYYSETLKSKAQGGFEIATDIYKQIPKPYYLYPYFITYKGEVMELPVKKSKDNVTGYDCIYDFQLGVDSRMEKYISILGDFEKYRKSLINVNPLNGQVTIKSFNQYSANEMERLSSELFNFEVKNPAGETKTISHGLLESSLLKKVNSKQFSENARQFTCWYRDDNFRNLESNGYRRTSSPDDKYFIMEINKVVYDRTLSNFDAISIILMPVGFDFIGDGMGALYAGYYKDYTTAGMYATAFAVPIANGAIITGLANGTKRIIRVGEEFRIIDNVISEGATWFKFLDDIGDGWTDAMKATFKETVEKNQELKTLVLANEASRVDIANAWRTLHVSGSGAKASANAISKLARLQKSNTFGWSSSEFEKVFARLNKELVEDKAITFVDDVVEEATSETIELIVGKKLTDTELIDVLDKLNDAKIKGTNNLLKELCCESTWKAVGAEMVLRTVEKGNYWGRVTGFEVVHKGVNGTRYIDIMVDNVIRIEVKSWKRMYSATFIKQFIEKDLANVTSLNNLKWVFDGKYGNLSSLKADIINVLEKNGKSKLNNPSIIKLFDDYAGKINYTNSINNADDLIVFMKEDDNWFNLIFSLK